MLADGPFPRDQLVDFVLRAGQRLGVGGLVAGDEHPVVRVVVPAYEAEVAERAEARHPQVFDELVVAGGGDLRGPAGPCGGDPHQSAALLIGEGQEQQAVGLVFAGVVAPVGRSGAAPGADKGAVQQNHLPTLSDDSLQSPIRALGRAASSVHTSSTQRRTVAGETPLPLAMSRSRWSWRSTASARPPGPDALPAGHQALLHPVVLEYESSRSTTKTRVEPAGIKGEGD